MKIFKTIADLRSVLRTYKGSSIGFVPTMGALHEGHTSLIKESVKNCEITVCSIFVNPTQFDNKSDLEKYPSTIENDIKLLEVEKCDILFIPSVDEIYTSKAVTTFNFKHLETVMEGSFRPGHFNGVALIVSKLFNIVQPNNAFFGKKDFQQLAIIKQLVLDLNFNIEIIGCATKRENSGLAMSSRNKRLTNSELNEAPKIYESLLLAKEMFKDQNSTSVQKEIENFFSTTNIKLEYFEIVNSKTLKSVNSIADSNEITFCIAAYLGNVRLIDNINL